MLRITGGQLRGRKIKTLEGKGTRPMLSRIRKSLFDLIGNRITDADFLDLFAGTGSVGIEALSRNAASATFIEKEAAAIEVINGNLSLFDLSGRARVYRRDVLSWLSLVAGEGEAFDIIFVGPPYFQNLADKVLEQIPGAGILKEDGLIFIQHYKKEKIVVPDGLELAEERKYGDMFLSIITLKK